MFRSLVTAALLLVLAALASAQPPVIPASGFGGGVRPPTPPLLPQISPLMPSLNPIPGQFPAGSGMAGGIRPPRHGFPTWGVPSFWGGYFPYYGYGGGFYPAEMPVPVTVPVPVIVQGAPPSVPPVAISGEAPAVLTLEFPAAAEVWVAGKKGPGEPATEWTLTSPVLKTGTEFTFDVKAQWKAGGKTFEYARTVTVAAGDRSRALVVSGTEIKE
jgi:uncharacterized protein (TIGR03000 family)